MLSELSNVWISAASVAKLPKLVTRSVVIVIILWVNGTTTFGQIHNVSNESELATAIFSSTSGDTINITGSFSMSSDVGRINKDLTINGNGFTINGGNQFRPFYVESGTVDLNNLTIQDGRHRGQDGGEGGGGSLGAGGALFVDQNGTVRLQNVGFQSNSAIGGNGQEILGSQAGDGGSFEGNASGAGATVITSGTIVGADGAFGSGGGAAYTENGGTATGGNAGFGGGAGAGFSWLGGTTSGGNAGYGGGAAGAVAESSGVANGGDAGHGGGGGLGLSSGSGTATGGNADGGVTNNTAGSGGGGGAGFGGAVFVRNGGTVEIGDGVLFNGNSVSGGLGGVKGGGDGYADGNDLYLMTGATAILSGSDFGIFDSISGEGSIQTQGSGTRNIDGFYDFPGTLSVSSGKLVVNGTVTGEVLFSAGGSLGGSGTIGTLTQNLGTLQPGNSIGTLNVSGNMTSTDGITEIEIEPGGNIPGVHNDFIDVQGTATISGGQIIVRAAPGTYVEGTRFTFLEAAGGVTGTFASITDDLPLFDTELGYSPTSVYFTLVRNQANFASVVQNSENRGVAEYFDQQVIEDGSDFDFVVETISLQNSSQITNSFQQIGGGVYNTAQSLESISSATIQNSIAGRMRRSLQPASTQTRLTGSFNSQLERPKQDFPVRFVSYQSADSESFSLTDPVQVLHAQPENHWTQWTLGYGLTGSVDSHEGSLGAKFHLGGICYGIERHLDESNRVGVFAGYTNSLSRIHDGSQSVRSNSGYFGALYSANHGRFYGILNGSVQFSQFQSERNLSIGAIQRTASGSYNGWQSTAYSELGTNFSRGRSVAFQPFVSLQYTYGRTNSFREEGADSLNLLVEGSDHHSLRGSLGGRLNFDRKGRRWMKNLSSELRAQYQYQLLDESIITTGLQGATGPGFQSSGVDLGEHWAVAGGGLTYQFTDRLFLQANYDFQFNDRQEIHSASGRFSYSW